MLQNMKNSSQKIKYMIAVIIGYSLCTMINITLDGQPSSIETEKSSVEAVSCPSCTCTYKKSEDLKDTVRKPLTPKSMYDVIGYDYFTKKKVYNSYYGEAGHGFLHHEKEEIKELTDEIVKNYGQNSTNWKLLDIQNGYRRVDPIRGIEYVLDLELHSKREGRRNVRFKLIKPVREVVPLSQESIQQSVQNRRIHFILPVSSVGKRFLRFIQLFEEIALMPPTANVTLILVLFTNQQSTKAVKYAEQVKNIISHLNEKYKGAHLSIIERNGEFSRGLGIDMGVRSLPPDALMYFCDVDVTFTLEFFQRCQLNALQGKQVYYPIVFSQYNPDIVKLYTPEEKFYGLEKISKYTGHFVHYAYGMVCLYQSDYVAVGGFDLSRQGWGGEDVELFTKHAKSQLNVVRAMDPGLIHIFHPKLCDKTLTPDQYQMCIQSAGEGVASRQQLGMLLLDRFNGTIPKMRSNPGNT